MVCLQGRTIRRPRRRETSTPMVVVEILAKSTRFARSSNEVVAPEAKSANGSTLKVNKVDKEK